MKDSVLRSLSKINGCWRQEVGTVDLCFLNETHPETGRALGFASCLPQNGGPDCGGEAQRSLSTGAHKVVPRLSQSAAPGGYCHALSVGDRTKEARVGLPVAHVTLDRAGPVQVFERMIPRLNGWWSQREAHGLERWANHNQRFAFAWLRWHKLLPDLRAGLPNHGSLHTQCYLRRPWRSGCQGLRPTGVSDCLFRSQLGLPPYPDHPFKS
jgi:hypothetical protein